MEGAVLLEVGGATSPKIGGGTVVDEVCLIVGEARVYLGFGGVISGEISPKGREGKVLLGVLGAISPKNGAVFL